MLKKIKNIINFILYFLICFIKRVAIISAVVLGIGYLVMNPLASVFVVSFLVIVKVILILFEK